MNELELLRPREVAEMFGVRTSTVARWVREGKLHPYYTPGGQRRYDAAEIRKILTPSEYEAKGDIVADAVRMYEQGWSIRQVGRQFYYSYGAMRRLLKANTTLRDRGGSLINPVPNERED